MFRRLAATLLLSLVTAGLLAPAGAFAQADPFTPLPSAPSAQPTVTAAPTTTTSSDSGGLDRWQEILIFIGGVILVLGIGYAILRDAKKVAPVEDERAFYRESSDLDPKKAQQKARNRKKTKAQRAARRHNR